jgi:hypothetical protein
MLRFSGTTITGFVDNTRILTAIDSKYPEGMVGLVSGSKNKTSNIAFFDNLIIKPVNGTIPSPSVISKKVSPMYKATSK